MRPSYRRRLSGGASSTQGSRDRSTPSTWASRTAASCSGLGTPASRSRIAADLVSAWLMLVRGPRGSVSPPRAALPSSAFVGKSLLQGLDSLREVHLDVGVEDRLQVTVEHLVEVVGLVAGAVVGDAVLGVVVGADPLGPVHGPDLAATRLAGLGVRLLLGRDQQPGPQDPECLLLVLQLALLVLAAHHDAGRQVRDPDRRVGGVDALAARPAAAEDVDAQVVVVDGDVDLLGLRQDQDAGGAGVHPPLRLG